MFRPEPPVASVRGQHEAVAALRVLGRGEALGYAGQQSQLHVPVYCVEEGRWFAETKYGDISAFQVPSRLRAANLRHDNQHQRWDDIRKMQERTEKQRGEQINNQTNCICDIYEAQKQDIDAYVNAFTYPREAVGFIASINNHIFELQAFGGCQRLFRGNFKGLIGALAAEALDKELCSQVENSRTLTVNQFLRSIMDSRQQEYKSVGLGHQIMFESDCGVVGCCLVNERNVVHLETFLA